LVDIRHRIERLYAAVGATIDEELNKFPPTIAVTDREIFIRQDFTGGLTEAQISNIGFTAIHLLAHLVDHLRGWAKRNGRSKAEVDSTVDNCFAISTLIDLSNRDKHGAPTHDAGRTGKAPRIDRMRRVMSLSTGPEKGSAVRVQITPSGPNVSGSGSAAVVVTGEIVASDNTRLGDLRSFLLEALAAWEALLARWGLFGQSDRPTP